MDRVREFLSVRWDLVLVVLLLAYFGARLLFFALQIHPLVPPDEVDHVGRSQVFSKALLIPEDSPASYEYGVIARHPYLYYFLIGKLLLLSGGLVEDVIFLRLVNVLLGLLTVYIGYRWIRLVTENKIIHVLFVVLVTNVLMFTAISASVNYDNLTNLLAAASLFYLSLYLEERRPLALAGFLIALFAGCLTKISFLPMALILVVIFLVREGRQLRDFRGYVRGLLSNAEWRRIGAFGIAVFLLALTIGLYGVNRVVYGRWVPTPEQVLDLEDAMKNRIFARNYVVSEFRAGTLTYEQAVSMAEKIKNPGNRRRALNLLRVSRDPVRIGRSLMAPEYYAYMWSLHMLSSGFGYHGHRVIRKIGWELYPVLLILGMALFFFVRKWHPREAGGHLTNAAVVSAFYALVLMMVVNYPIYRDSGVLDFVLQGRYFFPALIPFCGLVAYYVLAHLPSKMQKPVAVAVALALIYGDLPFFLKNVTACWFMAVGGNPECVATL